MSTTNKKTPINRTLEGGRAGVIVGGEQALRRAVLSTFLWEKQFYESGVEIGERIAQLVPQVEASKVHELAVVARSKYNLRHVPLLLLVECLKHSSHKKGLSNAIESVVQRPDELCEIVAMYAERNQGNRTAAKQLDSLANQLKKGLGAAFNKFNEYQFGKYDQDQKQIKLRDVLQLVHPAPKNSSQSALFKKILDKTLEVPDTWEVALSEGGKHADKRKLWTRLLQEGKLGALALLRNLRNIQEAGVDLGLIRDQLKAARVERVLPFRFIAAARYAPQLEDTLEATMYRSLEGYAKLPGTTALVVDTSPSMWGVKVSAKSEMDRFDAAAALAILVREVCEYANVYAFNERSYTIPSRRGFALRDSLAQTKASYSRGGLAVKQANIDGYDRIVVITDGEWHPMEGSTTWEDGLSSNRFHSSTCPSPLPNTQRYMVNIAAQCQGVNYAEWTNIEGWSEAVLQFIQASEEVG